MIKKLVVLTLTFSSSYFIAITAEAFTFPDQYNQFYSYYQEKAQAIVKKMTLEEKIGQMTLTNMATLKSESTGNWEAIEKYNIGAILADADEMPLTPDLKDWQKLTNMINQHTASTQHIPLLLGTDAVHGNQHVANAVIFPHNIGLGATHDPKLIQQIAAWTAYDVKLSGFNWAFAPTVAIVHDYRWGRTYESFGSDPRWVSLFAKAYIQGAQNINNDTHQLRGVLTSTKHFIGDGNTDQGIDEGNTTVTNDEQFHRENYPGYEGAFSAGTGSVMISYSSVNKTPMSVNKEFLKKYLFTKTALSPQFNGFTVSDYNAISKAARGKPYHEILADAINAGMDMVMISKDDLNYISYDPVIHNYSGNLSAFYDALIYDYNLNDQDPHKITQQRIDEAVTHILQVKLAMGLFETSQTGLLPPHNGDENKVALSAAEKSLVLLKNDQKENKSIIPVNKTIKHIFLLSDASHLLQDDISAQCGGWTIHWQGISGNNYFDPTNASSILTGLKHATPAGTDIIFNLHEPFDTAEYTATNTIAIALIAEHPYAEFMGDDDNDDYYYEINHHQLKNGLYLSFDNNTLAAIKTLKEKNIPIITVLISGRPMIVNHLPPSYNGIAVNDNDAPLNISNAFIAAWLPGTTGGDAIANAIFGRYHFRRNSRANTLPLPWPADFDQIRTGRLVCESIRKEGDPIPMYECGYGLTT